MLRTLAILEVNGLLRQVGNAPRWECVQMPLSAAVRQGLESHSLLVAVRTSPAQMQARVDAAIKEGVATKKA